MRKPLEDADPMPFGKHKGTRMDEVPAEYLHWLWGQIWERVMDQDNPVADYIRRALTSLETETPDLIWTKPKQMNRHTQAESQMLCDQFNEKYHHGTPVTYYKLVNPLREPTETRTRSNAWVADNGLAVIFVEKISGYVLLEAVVPI